MRPIKAITAEADREIREPGVTCLKRQGAGETEPSTMARCSLPKGHDRYPRRTPHSWEVQR